VAELWTELHEAMYADKRIKFRKPNPTVIQLERSLNCSCELIHKAVEKCPHHNEAHRGLCREVVKDEAKKDYERKMVSRGLQTDRTLSPSRSRSTSIKSDRSDKEPARGRGGYHRGGHGGHTNREDSRVRGKDYVKKRSDDSRENRDRSRSALKHTRPRSPESRPQPPNMDRGRYHFKRPSQPAQDRLKEERRKMEEPSNRQKAEATAREAKKEAERIQAQLDQAEAGPSNFVGKIPRKKPQMGDRALDASGQVDWNNCPVVVPPAGMTAKIVVTNGRWDVVMTSKDA
jgi:hypothetical protein